MLIKFQVKNYKSYKDEMVFSMMKAKRIQDLPYSILTQKIKGKLYSLLSSSVLYGANASGKSNINDAMNTLKTIVLRGDIKNTQRLGKQINAQSNLELVPFLFSDNKIVEFYIEFIENKNLYTYSLRIDVGGFLNANYPREVVYEKLEINSEVLFERENNLITSLKYSKDFDGDLIEDLNGERLKIILNESLVENSLFLTNGFKTVNKKYSQEVINWFDNKFIIVPNLEGTFTQPIFEDRKMYIDTFVNQIAKQSGMTGSDIAYIKDESAKTITTSLIDKDNTGKAIALPIQVIESYGTNRIVQLMPLILSVLKCGGTLVVDELDVALNSKVMMNLINIFHNDEININQAQLIFNTHNPIYLNVSILRRDEIKFVEKDEFTHESKIYSLSDFGTVGSSGVRKTTDYIKNYFMNKYGAVPDLDYTDIFLQAMRGYNDVKGN